MSIDRPSRPRRSSLRRGLRAAVLTALLVVPVAVVLLAVETGPRVAGGTPDAAQADLARTAATRFRDLMSGTDFTGGLRVSEAEMNGILASAERLVPGVRGQAAVDDRLLAVDLSAGAPLLPAGVWANLHLGLAESDEGLVITEARLGRLPLPAGLVEWAVRTGLDRAVGPGAGGAAMDSVAGLALSPGEATVAFNIGEEGTVPLLELLRSRARGAAGSDAREQARVQLWYIDRAVRAGELPRAGSVLPYLRFAIAVAEREDAPERERVRGALYALALYCGDPGFETVVGVSLGGWMQGRQNGCAGTTLGGREDLRKHFVISAALHAATSGTAAFGMGELKELVDSNDGGTGFSFDDIAADAAGLRFAATFLGTPPASWPAFASGIGREADILPVLDDLPTGLSDTDFRARYGNVDSAAYAAMVAEIDRRVEALPLHATARF